MIAGMASKVRLDALEESKIDSQGEGIAAKNGKESARHLVAEAHEALPTGVPDNSPYKKLSRDDLLAEAARLDMRLGPLMSEEDLRLVIEVLRIKMTRGDNPPTGFEMPQPAPDHKPRPRKIRGLKPSASNSWVVIGRDQKAPPLSVGGGQMANFRNGSVLELRHYSENIMQSLVDQGLKLAPVEDGDPDED